MTSVSNNPTLSLINLYHVNSYFAVASFTIVAYDCILTFAQELELIWTKQWSFMTVLYISVRYIGIPFNILNLFATIPDISVRGAGCNVIHFVSFWMWCIVDTMLKVIMIARVYAMYQGSRKILIFLVVISLPIATACVAFASLQISYLSWGDHIVSGAHQCVQVRGGSRLSMMAYVLLSSIIWQLLLLCLVIWSAVKHSREWFESRTAESYLVLLTISHVIYSLIFVVVSCLFIGVVVHTFMVRLGLTSVGGEVWMCCMQVLAVVQMFVLGPRLILSVRAYNANAVSASEEATAATTIAFRRNSEQSSC